MSTKKCPEHPAYKGMRKPRSGCSVCAEIYQKQNPDPAEEVEIDLLNAQKNTEIKRLKRRYEVLLKKYRELKDIVDIFGMVNDTVGSIQIRPVPRAKLKKGNSEAVAVLALGDWHVEERVMSAAVSGLNEFNLEICEQRVVGNLFPNFINLLKMHQQNVNIKTIMLPLLGDLISNYLHDDQKETNLLPPIPALKFAYELLVKGIDAILAQTNCDIKIPCVFGNHGRMTEKKRSNNKVGTSLELVIYLWLTDHYRNESRVTVEIAAGSLLYINVFDWVVRIHHGDNIKFHGGVGGITIPAYKAIKQWNIGRHADLDLFGHWHQLLDLGSFIQNGSLIGYSPYSVDIKAPFEPPTQAMFLIDRDRTPLLKRHTFLSPVMLESISK
jgi:hypothetical protein